MYYISIEFMSFDVWPLSGVNSTFDLIRFYKTINFRFEVVGDFVFTSYCILCMDNAKLDQLIILYLETGGSTANTLVDDDVISERMRVLKELARLLSEI